MYSKVVCMFTKSNLKCEIKQVWEASRFLKKGDMSYCAEITIPQNNEYLFGNESRCNIENYVNDYKLEKGKNEWKISFYISKNDPNFDDDDAIKFCKKMCDILRARAVSSKNYFKNQANKNKTVKSRNKKPTRNNVTLAEAFDNNINIENEQLSNDNNTNIEIVEINENDENVIKTEIKGLDKESSVDEVMEYLNATLSPTTYIALANELFYSIYGYYRDNHVEND